MVAAMQRFVIAVVIAALGCNPPPTKEAKAAEEQKAKAQAEMEKGVAEQRKKREAEAKAKADKEAAYKAALDKACVLPAKLPKKLNKACQAAGEAHDAFMKRQYADDAETLEKWSLAAGTQIKFTVSTCTKGGSLEVAACQKHALDNAPPELKEDATEILKTCIDKFGKAPEAGGAPQ